MSVPTGDKCPVSFISASVWPAVNNLAESRPPLKFESLKDHLWGRKSKDQLTQHLAWVYYRAVKDEGVK